jgi:hypothetical protein
MIDFEWDPTKAMTNLRKHGAAFREAATVFRDPLSITAYDPDHSEEEERFITVGTSVAGRSLIVAHTDPWYSNPHDQHTRVDPCRA